MDHKLGEYVRGLASANTVEGFFSLLKRGVIGTYHRVSEQHLNQYPSEFNFRYNERHVSGGVHATRLIEHVHGKRLMLKTPTRKAEARAQDRAENQETEAEPYEPEAARGVSSFEPVRTRIMPETEVTFESTGVSVFPGNPGVGAAVTGDSTKNANIPIIVQSAAKGGYTIRTPLTDLIEMLSNWHSR